VKPRHIGLYSNPFGRFYEYLRGGFWNLAELSILEDEFSYAAEELTWTWDELLWAYWEPKVSRRRVRGLEKSLYEAFEALPEEARHTFERQVREALSHYDPPCYSPLMLRIAFGPSVSIPLDRAAPFKALDNLRLMVRKEYRLNPEMSYPECPCHLIGPNSLFGLLSRFYEYVGYRTSHAPPLGRPNQVVALFDNDIDVHDVALVERSITNLCRRTPNVYRPEIEAVAVRLFHQYPSATLERLIRDRDW
jgi:hypothetical protein